jgi:hypothetical protein
MADTVCVLRSSDRDGKSYGGFRWPDSGPVEAPDWSPRANCGNGLHGLLWGIGDWSLCRTTDPSARWQVVEVDAAAVVTLGDKVKFPRGAVIYSGGLPGALALIAERRLIHLAAQSETASTTGYAAPASTTGYAAPASTTGNCAPASTTGNCAPASTTGYAPASTTGDRAPASTTGNYAPASTTGNHAPASTTGNHAPASTTGNSAPASTTGDRAPASTTGNYAPASTTGNHAPASTTGNHAPASTTGWMSAACCLGPGGRVKAGDFGSIILTRWDETAQRFRHTVAYVGEAGIDPHVWYELDGQGRIIRSAIQDKAD